MNVARRKTIRLPGSEYEAGWFFVTICARNRENLFASIHPTVGADDSVRPRCVSDGYCVCLAQIGEVIDECLRRLSDDNIGIHVDKYVIMPNHIHAIICMDDRRGGQSRPPLQGLVQQLKSITTRKCWMFGERTIWQRSDYDHVIRNERDHLRIWQYIDNNPAQWVEDEYYISE